MRCLYLHVNYFQTPECISKESEQSGVIMQNSCLERDLLRHQHTETKTKAGLATKEKPWPDINNQLAALSGEILKNTKTTPAKILPALIYTTSWQSPLLLPKQRASRERDQGSMLPLTGSMVGLGGP